MRACFTHLLIILAMVLCVQSCKDDSPEETEPTERWNLEHRNHAEINYRYQILDMSFTSPDSGWAVGEADWTLFKFNGRNWVTFSENPDHDGNFSAVCSVNDSTIYLATENGVYHQDSSMQFPGVSILKSTNNGHNFKVVYNTKDVNVRFTHIRFANDQVGYCIKSNPGAPQGINNKLLVTKDSGKTWQNSEIAIGGLHWILRDIEVLDAQTVIVCGWTGNGGLMFRTSDGGNTWNRIHPSDGANPVFPELLDLEAASSNVIYCSSDDRIFKSTDGGLTWLERFNMQEFPYEHKCLYTEFINVDVGYSIGIGEKEGKWTSDVLRTDDGGATWSRVYLNKEPDGFGEFHNFIRPDQIYIWPNGQDAWIFGNAVDRRNGTPGVVGYFGHAFFWQQWIY